MLFGVFLILYSQAAIIQSCPRQCRCDPLKDRVFCHSRGLIKIPKNIPRDTTQLFLQDNKLQNSDELDIELSKLTRLQKLMIFNNNLERIPKINSLYLRKLKIDSNRYVYQLVNSIRNTTST